MSVSCCMIVDKVHQIYSLFRFNQHKQSIILWLPLLNLIIKLWRADNGSRWFDVCKVALFI
ncbi:hypothetical protein FAES_0433 [Fibrella aestuarina BUZ 2]|uniref:Uncharacterized protein n=1 Tax=Fibrella aestuarina BUZ 2 TaxID=1166018 RepID=I0K2U2_9BACT|nr:hypothetical protein FAES_0433 [Fibrella aestuarina BUZ 2]